MDDIRRCYYCNKPCLVSEASKAGRCPSCGSRKFRNVTQLTDAEMEEMVSRGFKPEGWEHHDSPLG